MLPSQRKLLGRIEICSPAVRCVHRFGAGIAACHQTVRLLSGANLLHKVVLTIAPGERRNARLGWDAMSAATGSIQYRAGEFAADRFIHMTGTLAGVVGSAIVVGIAAGVGGGLPPRASSIPFALSRCLAARPPTTSPPAQPDEGFCTNLIMPRSF